MSEGNTAHREIRAILDAVKIVKWAAVKNTVLKVLHQFGKCDHLSVNSTFFAQAHTLKKKQQNLKSTCEITHATGKYLQGLMGPVISEGSSNQH